VFRDRVDAGRRLAELLEGFGGEDVIVLGLPRGGVPVAAEVAAALGAPLDVIVIRKLGSPRNPEFAVGAIGEGGVRIIDERALRTVGLDEATLAEVEAAERAELDRRCTLYRWGRDRLDLAGRRAIIVDDGVATGSTAAAACRVARALGAVEIVLAVPVAPSDWVDRLGGEADRLVAVATPEPFFAVGQFYAHFSQTTDAEVADSLHRLVR
jgi:predicted phosphoribosyltransferase